MSKKKIDVTTGKPKEDDDPDVDIVELPQDGK